jgi:hypothetical protein
MRVRNIINQLFRRGSQQLTAAKCTPSLTELYRQEDLETLDAHLSTTTTTNNNNNLDLDLDERVSTHVLQQTVQILAQLQSNRGCDHQLSVQDSLVGENSGDGLFLHKGTRQPGNVVALYPGTAVYHEELAFFGGVHHMFQEEEMDWFIHRADGVLIDGLGKTHALNAIGGGGALGSSDGGDVEGGALAEVMEKLTRLQKHGTLCAQKPRANPFASAHKANHPPEGVPANVVAVAIDYDFNAMDANLFPYIPIRHAILPNVLCEHGIAFVASRVIEAGDEIYLDYATSEESRPVWYKEAARVRGEGGGGTGTAQ